MNLRDVCGTNTALLFPQTPPTLVLASGQSKAGFPWDPVYKLRNKTAPGYLSSIFDNSHFI